MLNKHSWTSTYWFPQCREFSIIITVSIANSDNVASKKPSPALRVKIT